MILLPNSLIKNRETMEKINTERKETTHSGYEMVNSPEHYNRYSVEVIEMLRRIYGTEATALFCEMTAFVYRMRMGTKPNNPIEQELAKEAWNLNKAKELRGVKE